MDFLPTASPKILQARSELLKKTRAFLDSRGFVEVQTPLLSADTVIDEHLDPVPVLLPHDAFDLNSGRQLFLQTSPEFHMKRLLAAGMTAIYQLTPAFRIGESGQQHNPEFTMLEWYRCGDDMQLGMQFLSDFASEILDRPAAKIQSMSRACESLAGFNPFVESADGLRARCEASNIAYSASMDSEDWDAWLELLFTHLVQPKLGYDQPVIIGDYPASQAALAKTREVNDPSGTYSVAERFELFVDGVELGNGYHELLDPDELLARNRITNEKREKHGKSPLPEESKLLEAMRAGLPACSGVAVGFDRLLMLAVGAASIRDVLSFPIDRA